MNGNFFKLLCQVARSRPHPRSSPGEVQPSCSLKFKSEIFTWGKSTKHAPKPFNLSAFFQAQREHNPDERVPEPPGGASQLAGAN
jgi:hypothetical protein